MEYIVGCFYIELYTLFIYLFIRYTLYFYQAVYIELYHTIYYALHEDGC